MFETPIFLEGDAGGGSGGGTGGAPAADAGATTAPAPDAGGGAADATTAAPTTTEPVVTPTWEERVQAWGGESTIERAIRIDKVLDTPEGQDTLIREGLIARGYSAVQIEEFLHPTKPAGQETQQQETIEQLLADPDRQLTAGEIKRVLDAREFASNQAREQQQIADNAQITIRQTLDTSNVPEENRQVILQMADAMLPIPGQIPADQGVIAAAITRATAEFNRQVEAAAKGYIEGKAQTAGGLPTPLPAGGSGGTEQPSEPMTVAEASARVRAKHGW
jgi:hypothetical protein